MTQETALTLRETMGLGDVLARSGYFKDAGDEAKAVVKVLAGREMGFGPIASMTGVHIVQGKPTIGANLLGAAIKGSGRYNYRVLELTNERAEIAFFEHGEEIGRSVFTMDDAKAAGLAGKGGSWKTYPRNMLFSRAISNGARWYCPDVFSGVTPYTPEEMGAEVTVDDDGDVIDVTPTVKAKPAPGNGDGNNKQDITNKGQLYEAVKPLEYYKSIPHMLSTMRKIANDPKLEWNTTGSAAWYNRALEGLTEYAEANKAQADEAKAVIAATAEQMEAPF